MGGASHFPAFLVREVIPGNEGIISFQAGSALLGKKGNQEGEAAGQEGQSMDKGGASHFPAPGGTAPPLFGSSPIIPVQTPRKLGFADKTKQQHGNCSGILMPLAKRWPAKTAPFL